MFRSLRGLTISVILALVIVLTGALGGFSLYMLYSNSHSAMMEEVSSVGAAYEASVNNKISAIKQALQTLALNSEFVDNYSDPEALTEVVNRYCDELGYTDILIIDSTGMASPNAVDLSGREYFQKAIAGETYISEPLVNKVSNSLMFFVATPINDPETGFKGVLAAAVSWDTFNDMISGVKIGANGVTNIFNNEGIYIAHSEDTSYVTEQQNVLDVWAGTGAYDAMNEAISNTKGITDTFDNNGSEQFVYYATIEGTNNWSLTMRVLTDDFMATFNSTLKILIILMCAFLVFGVIIALAVAKVIADPVKKVAVRLEKLSNGDLDSDMIESRSKNELGTLVRSLEKTVLELNKYINNISEMLTNVSSGDLTQNVTIEYLGDFSPIKDSINSIVSKLNEMFGDINASTTQVATGSKQIADGAQALAQSSTEQAAAVEQLSSSISEVADKTRDNADMSAQAASLGNTIKGNAEKGSHQMDQMLEAVKEINQASQSISKVIKVIEDIAFQTNILALNAAVEAARAGQHGKGFAVVAEEVRSLAAKSADAAKDTGALISNSIEKAELGARIAEDTAVSLTEIVTGINESSRIVSEIARSSEEQLAAITQINKGIDQVAQIVQQNSATAEESAAASEEMSGQSNMLEELVGQFRLSNPGLSGRNPSLPSSTWQREKAGYALSASDEFGKY